MSLATNRLRLTALGLCLSLAASSTALAQKREHSVHPTLSAFGALANLHRLGPMKRRLDASSMIPVVITVETGRATDALRELARRGADDLIDPVDVSGSRSHLSLRLPATGLAMMETLPGFLAATLDIPLVRKIPLDISAVKAGVTPLRHLRTSGGLPLTGQGVTICDIDSGVDVFHPMFFKPDGGAFDFVDKDENGRLDPGIDGVDLGDGVHTIRAMNGEVRDYFGNALFGTEDTKYDPEFDYLYVDTNENGKRDFGPDAGFDDAQPSFGEVLFVSDDVDADGVLDGGEKLIALKTSKIKVFKTNRKVFRRGENLSDAPWEQPMDHGTGAGSVLVGGQAGFRRLVGMAPDADLIAGNAYTENDFNVGWFSLVQFCAKEGANVVLHETAPIATYHIDGSTPVDELIDMQSAAGISHINPAGNYSSANKQYKNTISPAAPLVIPIELPSIGATYVYGSIWLRDTMRPLTVRVSGPGATNVTLPLDGMPVEFGNQTLFGGRDDSSRGTSRYDYYIFDQNGVPLPVGSYSLEVVDGGAVGSPAIDIVAFVDDEVSGWGPGAGFTDHVTEDHLIGWPGNADKGLAVAAFTATAYEQGTPDERAYYSGRGFRIDGEKNLWISAPADPIAANRFDDAELGYWIYGGTSGASPHVAGVAALIKEVFPEATGDEVKEKIRLGAVADEHTGATPNEDWGHGKLDAYRSIFGEAPKTSAAPSIGPAEVTIPSGAGTIALAISDADSDASAVYVEIDRTYDGTFEETLMTNELAVDFAKEGDYRIRLRATDEAGARAEHILAVHVTDDVGTGGEPNGEVELAGGGGCAVAGPAPRGGFWLGGALAFVVALFRRRGLAPKRPSPEEVAPTKN